MAGLLPSSPDTSDAGGGEPRVVGVDSDAADDLLSALSSRTARRVLAELHEEPSSPSALADRVDTSLQNVQYHLGKLSDADLVEVVDTVYSEKGREMKVYAPADRALIVVAGREEDATGLRATLSRLLGGVGALAVASLLVDRLLGGPTANVFTSLGGTSASVDRGASPDGGDAGGSSAGSGGSTDIDYQSQNADATDGTAASADGTASSADGSASTPADGSTATPTADSTGADGPAAADATRTEAATTADAATETAAPDATTTAAPDTTTAAPDGGGSPTGTAEATEAVTTAFDAADPVATVDALAAAPGALFFLGGLTVLLLATLALASGR
ncbi:ArsR/SmtB family transcription factor [Halegenticoccus soli]|uniref:ArsR/SmtB family transcription factor n=1 Tax=Halegenticoccus soli TaxID=1985678 RepID=UPI000C6E30D3|nr:helix-turn-helix domain-containing protein [Halegenticoccus soli]